MMAIRENERCFPHMIGPVMLLFFGMLVDLILLKYGSGDFNVGVPASVYKAHNFSVRHLPSDSDLEELFARPIDRN